MRCLLLCAIPIDQLLKGLRAGPLSLGTDVGPEGEPSVSGRCMGGVQGLPALPALHVLLHPLDKGLPWLMLSHAFRHGCDQCWLHHGPLFGHELLPLGHLPDLQLLLPLQECRPVPGALLGAGPGAGAGARRPSQQVLVGGDGSTGFQGWGRAGLAETDKGVGGEVLGLIGHGPRWGIDLGLKGAFRLLPALCVGMAAGARECTPLGLVWGAAAAGAGGPRRGAVGLWGEGTVLQPLHLELLCAPPQLVLLGKGVGVQPLPGVCAAAWGAGPAAVDLRFECASCQLISLRNLAQLVVRACLPRHHPIIEGGVASCCWATGASCRRWATCCGVRQP
mmetsp:Transcript_67508/g.119705  ORF Transcript_67508/g.119705 Transcript_67508/m.119705 type:complete len:335 (-) Transcript_67508:356-1360(-)